MQVQNTQNTPNFGALQFKTRTPMSEEISKKIATLVAPKNAALFSTGEDSLTLGTKLHSDAEKTAKKEFQAAIKADPELNGQVKLSHMRDDQLFLNA